MICRILVAFFISPAGAISAAVIVEIFFAKERGQKMGLWMLMITLGYVSVPLSLNRSWLCRVSIHLAIEGTCDPRGYEARYPIGDLLAKQFFTVTKAYTAFFSSLSPAGNKDVRGAG